MAILRYKGEVLDPLFLLIRPLNCNFR